MGDGSAEGGTDVDPCGPLRRKPLGVVDEEIPSGLHEVARVFAEIERRPHLGVDAHIESQRFLLQAGEPAPSGGLVAAASTATTAAATGLSSRILSRRTLCAC